MKLICGLGNPGEKYKNNRHNVGFMFLDRYAELNGFDSFAEKWNAFISEKGNGEKKIVLLKPNTYMNLSGDAVLKFMNFYKLNVSDLVVVFDDIDLNLGDLRLREKGSAGTHNGMKSIVNVLGTDEFTRLRVGIESRGVSSPSEIDIADFVLSNFSEEELPVVKNAIDEGIKLLENSLA